MWLEVLLRAGCCWLWSRHHFLQGQDPEIRVLFLRYNRFYFRERAWSPFLPQRLCAMSRHSMPPTVAAALRNLPGNKVWEVVVVHRVCMLWRPCCL